MGPIETKGADTTISFWDAPLWTQIAYSLQLLVVLLVSIKFAPIILEKLKRPRKTDKSEAVLNFIPEKPGVTISGIAKGTGINRDTVKYHIYNLISTGEAKLEKFGKYSLLSKKKHAAGGGNILAHFCSDVDKKIVYSMLEKPGINNHELVQLLNLDKSTIHWHIDRLIDDGIVVYEKVGTYKRYYVTIEAEKAVRELEH